MATEPLEPMASLNDALKPFKWSDSCAAFFKDAIKAAPPPAGTKTGISEKWFFLQLLVHGAKFHNNNDYSTVHLFKASRLTDQQLTELRNGLHGKPDSSGQSRGEIPLQDSLAETLVAAGNLGRRVGNRQTTSIRHLVAAFILRTTTDGRLLSYLELDRLGIPADAMVRAFRDHIKNRVKDESSEAAKLWGMTTQLIATALRGNQMQFSREASDHEGVLDVDRYAEVIATLMRQADDKEFNLAIYGHWGRGKTFLMKRTADALRRRTANDPREFETVTFSAWQYPSRPEVWIQLYETLAKAAFDRGFWHSTPNIVRTGIARRGYWGLLFAFVLGAIALIPITTRLLLAEDLLILVQSTVGLAGGLFVYAIYRAAIGTHTRLKREYLNAMRHADKLGLQATIGEDLAALLKGWLPGARPGGLFYASYALVSAFAAGTLMWQIQHWWPGQWRASSIAVVVAIIMSYAVCRWLFPWNTGRKKVLLVVDDLDRCDPSHLLCVMESIMMQLENPEISQRVLVTMLIEEDILKHAIWRKYAHLTDKKAAAALGTSFTERRIVRENCEKLFTVHLRLPPLAPEDISSVVERFALSEMKNGSGDAFPDSSNASDATIADESTTAGTHRRPKAAQLYIDDDKNSAIPLLGANQIVLSDEERNAIARELRRWRTTSSSTAPLGPRAIRAFIFRYQLTRLILVKRGFTDWKPGIVIATLAKMFSDEADTADSSVELTPEIIAVVQQVT